MDVRLDNKSAIITGAASGVGLATVHRFLESGAAGIVAVDRAAEAPASFAPFTLGTKPRLIYLRGDVTEDETARKFTDTAIRAFGRIDILINNAGVPLVKAIHETTEAEWDHVMDVNVKAAFHSARHVIPIMMKQRAGVILNTGSISALAGIPGQGAYAPSKGAIHQLTRQMAIEYAPYNIRVNAVGCGTIDTPMLHGAAKATGNPEGLIKMLKDNHPIGRIATADEIAGFFTYLASDLASFFTGAALMMDGGFTAR